MATKLKSFIVQAKCERIVGLEIQAKDLDEALAKAKELKDDDFVEVFGEYQDGNTHISGIYEA